MLKAQARILAHTACRLLCCFVPLARFTDNMAAATTTQGHPSSISFNGVLYDNVATSRRGVTSLSWAKPKLKFQVPDGFT